MELASNIDVISGDMIFEWQQIWSRQAAKSFPAERTYLSKSVDRRTTLGRIAALHVRHICFAKHRVVQNPGDNPLTAR